MQKVVGTLLIFFTRVGCEKKTFDYRNKYIGEYDMNYSYTYWQMGGVTSDTTIFYQGSVAYGSKGNLNITWYNGELFEFTVSKDGEISKCETKIGKISKKQFELSFTDVVCHTGPQGANYTVSLVGKRKYSITEIYRTILNLNFTI